MSINTQLRGKIGSFNKGSSANRPKSTLPPKFDRFPVIYSDIYKKFPAWLRALRRGGKNKKGLLT